MTTPLSGDNYADTITGGTTCSVVVKREDKSDWPLSWIVEERQRALSGETNRAYDGYEIEKVEEETMGKMKGESKSAREGTQPAELECLQTDSSVKVEEDKAGLWVKLEEEEVGQGGKAGQEDKAGQHAGEQNPTAEESMNSRLEVVQARLEALERKQTELEDAQRAIAKKQQELDEREEKIAARERRLVGGQGEEREGSGGESGAGLKGEIECLHGLFLAEPGSIYHALGLPEPTGYLAE